jgi:GT2 family glycosyltransferase
MRLTAAVLSYDGKHLLETMLPSLAAQTHDDLRVVVVDNGSTDGTAAWLAEAWPDVEVVRLEQNVGVTAGLNACLRAAAGSDLVALLNNDTELEPDCLARLAAALRDDPSLGSASGKLVDFHDRTVLDGAGDGFTWRGIPYRRGHGEPDDGRYDEEGPVFGACGGAAVYRTAAVEDVGGFDERFFAYYEDADWNLRAQLAGWGCRYVPSAVVFHMGSATLGRTMNDFTRYHLWRNCVWMVAKGFPAAALARHAPALLLGQALHLLDAIKDRRLSVWARALRDALRGLPAVLADRPAVQARRRARLRDLDRVVDPTRLRLVDGRPRLTS